MDVGISVLDIDKERIMRSCGPHGRQSTASSAGLLNSSKPTNFASLCQLVAWALALPCSHHWPFPASCSFFSVEKSQVGSSAVQKAFAGFRLHSLSRSGLPTSSFLLS